MFALFFYEVLCSLFVYELFTVCFTNNAYDFAPGPSFDFAPGPSFARPITVSDGMFIVLLKCLSPFGDTFLQSLCSVGNCLKLFVSLSANYKKHSKLVREVSLQSLILSGNILKTLGLWCRVCIKLKPTCKIWKQLLKLYKDNAKNF